MEGNQQADHSSSQPQEDSIMAFKFGKEEMPTTAKFWRVEMTKEYRDGTDVILLNTRYGRTKKEKGWAQKKADEINAKYDASTYKPKHARRLSTMQSATARVILVEEKVGGIPVYL